MHFSWQFAVACPAHFFHATLGTLSKSLPVFVSVCAHLKPRGDAPTCPRTLAGSTRGWQHHGHCQGPNDGRSARDWQYVASTPSLDWPYATGTRSMLHRRPHGPARSAQHRSTLQACQTMTCDRHVCSSRAAFSLAVMSSVSRGATSR